MTKFYVAIKERYCVWEPAEGGYYVPCWEVAYCKGWSTLEDAFVDMLECMMEVSEAGDKIYDGTWFTGFKTYVDDDPDAYFSRETYLCFPWFECGNDSLPYHTYETSERYKVFITTDKPEDEPYEGYC